jgi:hypothetical protein
VAPIEVMNFNHYEPDETRVMDLLAARTPEAPCWTSAPTSGWYAMRFAKRFSQALRLCVRAAAHEPTAFLQRNIAANGVGDQRVSSFNYGLSESGGTVNFFISA